ncbi:MAG TPA: type II toxin-antitoxin system prevent-host-death family antitoxin [Acidobacteriaceae bacterium]|nr:type II toxin-antitoxin system prevent-host-death family antitoxin [Acidobacteriaceae bacterium]
MRSAKKVQAKTARSRAANRLDEQPVAAAKAKAEFLGLIERVSTERRPVTITKRGKPLVQIVPIDSRIIDDPFGCMKGSVKVVGDIVGPEPDLWEAMA